MLVVYSVESVPHAGVLIPYRRHQHVHVSYVTTMCRAHFKTTRNRFQHPDNFSTRGAQLVHAGGCAEILPLLTQEGIDFARSILQLRMVDAWYGGH